MEADPSGGDLVTGFGLVSDPGLVSLAASVRRSRGRDLIWAHTQLLAGGLHVVAAPIAADQATAACDTFLDARDLTVVTDAGREPAADSEATPAVVIVDVGRLPLFLSARAGVGRLLAAADVVLVATRPDARSLAHVATRLEQLRTVSAITRLLVVGSGGYSPGEITTALGVPVAGVLPTDTVTAAALTGTRAPRTSRGRHLPLVRVAGLVASDLATTTHTSPDVTAAALTVGDLLLLRTPDARDRDDGPREVTPEAPGAAPDGVNGGAHLGRRSGADAPADHSSTGTGQPVRSRGRVVT